MKFKIKKDEIEEVVDYSKLATPAIFEMIKEMESRYGKDLELNRDETLSDSLAINEYRFLRQELDKREKEGIIKLDKRREKNKSPSHRQGIRDRSTAKSRG